eukprot:Gb_18982 [translate_table: standard]
MKTIITVISLAAYYSWKIYQMDVKSAFLNGELSEEVYMQQPPDFIILGQENKVYKLKKSLYKLKQSPRAWYARIDQHFHKQGFIQGESDNNIYVSVRSPNQIIIFIVYVDNLILTGINDENIGKVKLELK